MDNRELQLLRYALNLVDLYNPQNDPESEQVWQQYKRRGYQGKPLYFYIPILTAYSPELRKVYKDVFRTPATSNANRIRLYLKRVAKRLSGTGERDQIDNFFYYSKPYTGQLKRLRELTRPRGMFTANELQQIDWYSQQPDSPQAALLLQALIGRKQQEYAERPTATESLNQQKQESQQLVDKIKNYGKYMQTAADRQRLLEHPEQFLTPEDQKAGVKFSQEEFETILKSGLLPDAEGAVKKEPAADEEKKKEVPPVPPLPTTPTPTENILSNKIGPEEVAGATEQVVSREIKQSPIWISRMVNGSLSTLGNLFSFALNNTGKILSQGGSQMADTASGLLNNMNNFASPTAYINKIFIGIFVGIVVFVILMSFNGNFTTSPSPSGGGDIASCSFRRSGDSPADLKFKIPQWPALISEVASKIGIPSPVLAAILRVECANCFASGNPLYISGDYDDHNSVYPADWKEVENRGKPLAFGVMQFYPPTFQSIVADQKNQKDLANVGKSGLFAAVSNNRVSTSDRLNLLDPQGNPITQDRYNDPNDSLFRDKTAGLMRIFSIKDSLIATALKIKNQIGTGPYTIEQITDLVKSYYGGQCGYGSNDYCQDVWQSYNNCKPNVPSTTIASCPILGGKIMTPSYEKNGWNGLGGHCVPGYTPACKVCPIGGSGGSRRAKAIDVTSSSGGCQQASVYLPTLNGQKVRWALKVSDYDTEEGGRGLTFETVQGTDAWDIDFVHLKAGSFSHIKSGVEYESGTEVGKNELLTYTKLGAQGKCGIDWDYHIHTTLGKNLKLVVPGNFTSDCDPGWLASDFMCDGSSSTANMTIPSVSGQVVLDPGHGNPDSDFSQNKTPEGRLNLTVANKVRTLLASKGIAAILSHEGSIADPDNAKINEHYQNLQRRIDLINNVKGQIFVSIHFDASRGVMRGPTTYYNESRSFSSQNLQLAQLISTSISSRTGERRTVSTDFDTSIIDPKCSNKGPLYILGGTGVQTCPPDTDSAIVKATAYPGVLNEYFTNGDDYPVIEANTAFTDKIAKGYCDGILKYISNDDSKSCD